MNLEQQRIARVLAYLIRNEEVPPSAIARAVESARTMIPGELATLSGVTEDDELLRREFVSAQVERLWSW